MSDQTEGAQNLNQGANPAADSSGATPGDGFEAAVAALEALDNDGGVNLAEDNPNDPYTEKTPTEANLEHDEEEYEDVPDKEEVEAQEETEEVQAHGLDLDKITERERELFRERKKNRDRFSELEEQIRQQQELIEQMQNREPEQFAEEAPEVEDDRDDFERLIDDVLNGKNKNQLTREDVLDLLEERDRQRSAERAQELEQFEIEETMADFQSEINSFIEDNEDRFGVINSMGNSDLVLELIEQDYREKAEEFGFDYAERNMLSIEKAASYVNSQLEKQIESMLQSKPLRKLVTRLLENLSDTQPQSRQSPGTLSEDFNSSQSTGELDDEERFKRAIAAIS